MKYNNSSNIFSCYGSESNQWDVCLFRRTEIYDYPAEQIVALSAGWNWCSFNVDITLADLQDALIAAMPNSSITIQSETQSLGYENGEWTGELTTLDIACMYKILVDNACDISLEGMPVNPIGHPIIIENGSNWIAYPLSESRTLTNAFVGFAVDGDVVQSQTLNSRYSCGRWMGQLTSLVPGQGYVYKSNATDNRTLSFPN